MSNLRQKYDDEEWAKMLNAPDVKLAMNPMLVKKIRMEMGFTQRQFALKIGLKTQSPLSKMEDGLLSCGKYEDAIRLVFNQYRNERIEHLTNQIEYLKSIL